MPDGLHLTWREPEAEITGDRKKGFRFCVVNVSAVNASVFCESEEHGIRLIDAR